ncbi:hypothetical protein [Haloarchaeobius amylolyticus]|uniref:hypothetical protein n=1 Tax=Haloarchaeobius amylolyticus TaxID=1198296 RepID=UPI00226D4BA9|nr:hypothetical protein [Haloarchaeobius amylolyticus]
MDDTLEGVEDRDLRRLVERIDEATETTLRLVFRYEGDEREVVHVREDIREQFTDHELDERVKTLTMKGLGDPPTEQSLYDFGELNATLRFFEEVVVAVFPDGEWAGVVVVTDRQASPLVDTTLDFLGE